MYAWLVVAFLCGAAAGGLIAWYLLSRRVRPADAPAASRTPSPVPPPPDREATLEVGHAVSSLSETSQRMLTDLERRYEMPSRLHRLRCTRRPACRRRVLTVATACAGAAPPPPRWRPRRDLRDRPTCRSRGSRRRCPHRTSSAAARTAEASPGRKEEAALRGSGSRSLRALPPNRTP